MTPIYGGPATKTEATLAYNPGIKGGTDLEAATKDITATTEPGTPDYTTIHNIPAPTDSKLTLLGTAGRLLVNISAWAGGGTTLNFRVLKNGVSVATGILEAAGATGNKIVAFDMTTNLTGNQTYTIAFWVNAGTCTLDAVQLWSAVGTITQWNPILKLTHSGFASAQCYFVRLGSGTPTFRYLIAGSSDTLNSSHTNGSSSDNYLLLALALLATGVAIGMSSSVATDLPYVSAVRFNVRSEQ